MGRKGSVTPTCWLGNYNDDNFETPPCEHTLLAGIGDQFNGSHGEEFGSRMEATYMDQMLSGKLTARDLHHIHRLTEIGTSEQGFWKMYYPTEWAEGLR